MQLNLFFGFGRAIHRFMAKARLVAVYLIYDRTILLLTVLFCAGAGATLWHLSYLSSSLVESGALQGTSIYSQSLTELRAFYGSEVVDRVRSHGVEVTHDYATKKGAIPIPATFTIEFGKYISRTDSGMQVRLYSEYPFPFRKDGGPRDDFEREALRQLREQPTKPFFRFEDFQGRPSLRYATAVRLAGGCVSCHNTHPESPKTDWKVGDVRGVQEVIRPLDSAVAETRAGLHNTFVLLGTMGLLGLGGLALVIGRMRRVSGELERKAQEQEALNAIATAVSQSLRVDELLQIALDEVIRITRRDRASIRLKDPVTGEARLVAYRGFSQEEVETLRRRVAHNIIEQVFATGQPVVINDPAEHQAAQTLLQQIRSVAWVPIKSGVRVLGVLGVSASRPKPFAPTEVDLLQAVANIIGVGLENASLFEETKRNLEGIRALHKIDIAITSTLDLRAVLNVLLEKIDLFLPFSTATVRLFNKESGLLEPVACRNLDEKEWKEGEGKSGRGIPNAVIEAKRPVIIVNVQTDPRARDAGFFRKHHLVSYLGVPLVVKDEILGVLSFYTKEEHEFSAEEVEFLTTLAGQAAIAIHNSQLYEEMAGLAGELAKSNRELSALHAVAAAASQSLDLDRVFKAAIEKITEMFRFEATRIHIYDERTDELLLRASFETDPDRFSSARSFTRGRGIVGKVAESGKALVFEDIRTDPLYRQLSSTKVSSQFGYHFFAVFPIRGKQKNLGTLGCVSTAPRKLSSGEIQLLEAIAERIGVAIENRELYEQLKQKISELQQQTAELERANKVKDEFLSVMSHELRTPLNVVMGYTEMIRDKLLGEINPEQEMALEKVISRARDQLTMISSILQATRVEAGEVKVERREINLKEFLNDLKAGYAIPLGKELSLIWDFSGDLPVLATDDEKLKHILQNLINNAIKFTDRGTVTISARYLDGAGVDGKNAGHQRGNSQNGLVQFAVADTGAGIPREHFPVIFERFRQVDSSETRKYGGVGIGLYIVKKFTDLLGGTVEVESEPGKGSTFTVTIPAA